MCKSCIARIVRDSGTGSAPNYFKQQPYGVIAQKNALLLDLPSGNALIFPFSIPITTATFKVKVVPFRELFHCRPENAT